MSQYKFKTVESFKNGIKTLFIEKESYLASSLSDQITFITEKSKQGYEINVCEFPQISLLDVTSILKSYEMSPDIVRISIAKVIKTKSVEEEEIIINFNKALDIFTKAYMDIYNLVIDNYKLITVPSSFNLDINYTFLSSRVRRKKDSSHFLENEDIKALFNICFDYWISGAQRSIELKNVVLLRHEYNRNISIHQNSICIGCQTISRLDFEQIAVRLGFEGKKFTDTRKLKYTIS